MKKVILIIMAALMSATSVAQVKVSHSSVNPKMSELFDELTQLGRAPRVQKTGGMEQWGNLQQLHYSVRLWFRPDLWYSRQRKEEPSVLDSLLRAEKTSFEKQVKAIRRTLDKLAKEAQDKSLYDNQKSGKDTIYYALNLSHDTTRVYKLQEGNHTYYNSDEFLDFTLKSGKQEGTFEGRLSYTVTLPGIDLSSNTYSWGDMIDDIESLNAYKEFIHFGLTSHVGKNLVLAERLDAAGVHQQHGMSKPFAVSVDAVPGDTGRVIDDGEPLADQFVEQGGLAYIRSADDRNDRF